MKATERPDLLRDCFYAILDTAYVPRDRWGTTCRALIAGGADLIQIRAKTETSAERESLLRQVLPLFPPQSAAPHLIVNDDVELCARIPGVGLHIGQDDMPSHEARRRIGPDRLIGLSTHSWEQAVKAQSLPPGTIDYFCVGPVFATQTKPDYTAVGLELVQTTANSSPKLPWFAIGGINRSTVAEVVSAGAERIVVVSDVLTATNPAEVVRQLRKSLPPPSR